MILCNLDNFILDQIYSAVSYICYIGIVINNCNKNHGSSHAGHFFMKICLFQYFPVGLFYCMSDNNNWILIFIFSDGLKKGLNGKAGSKISRLVSPHAICD